MSFKGVSLGIFWITCCLLVSILNFELSAMDLKLIARKNLAYGEHKNYELNRKHLLSAAYACFCLFCLHESGVNHTGRSYLR